jgi:AcrR family transcriptional regulator
MRREQMRERLLDAAEETLRRLGPQEFTVRAVTAAAAVNVATVSAAFGGRSALIDGMFERLVRPINSERERRFAALAERPAVIDIVRAFVEPLALVERDRPATSAVLRLVISDSETRPIERLLTDPGIESFDALLAVALAEVTAAERKARIRLAIGTVVSAAAWSDDPAFDSGSLAEFVSAGLAGKSHR